MLNIGFIFPSSEYLFNPFRGDPHTHFQILTVIDDHFGNKLNLSLIDLRGIKKEFAFYHIHECDVYLYSAYTLDFSEQVSIVNNLRRRYPKAIHIAGGPHATVFQDECLKVFDSLIIGDGENSVIQAITDVITSKNLKKIYLESRPVDINAYSYPKRRYLPQACVAREGLMTLRNKEGYDRLLGTTVIFSRGCIYQCAFCGMPEIRTYIPGIRYREPHLIEAEIEYLKKDYGIEGINLLDEIGVPFNRQKAIAFLEAIGRTGIVWRAQTRVNGVTSEIAKLAKEAGCVTMSFGVESVSQRSLDIINKKTTVRQAREALGIFRENGIETRIYMILGLPGEPDDIVEQTWSFIKETGPVAVYLCLFTVRPGTVVFNNPEKFGIKHINTDWEKTMHMFGRYGQEIPTLTFEYEKETPWGKGMSNEQIINNYLELQKRILENNLGPI